MVWGLAREERCLGGWGLGSRCGAVWEIVCLFVGLGTGAGIVECGQGYELARMGMPTEKS